MNIIKFRREFIVDLREQIATNEKNNDRDQTSLANLLRMNVEPEILTIKRKELQDNIARRIAENDRLKQREADIEAGKEDDKIKNQLESTKSALVNKERALKQRQETTRDEKATKREEVYVKEKDDRKADSFKEYEKAYRYYCKVHREMTDAKRENLADMPCNKGYIYRGVWYFGKRREEYGQPLVMYETKGGAQLTHEITSTTYSIYEKKSKTGKRILKSSKQRTSPF